MSMSIQYVVILFTILQPIRLISMQKYPINRSRHAAFLLHGHLVFVTKYRKKRLSKLHFTAFNQYASECRDFGASLKESHSESEHAHMLNGNSERCPVGPAQSSTD
ncbi:putative is element transposase [Photorhabdus asymbiotica]|uniref:Is element transposase n=1 Tax=Photorhabdus asymbiotica subsp. asymbiotica (strain ATCC 43949 / 3105-77) TaxID=553480 RepID=B6VL88_PHOAA|nr:putative is element transposase [Photorhabdus asymbiotica]CAR66918.1 putative is element transposase [Photorhabdus asymbiotica subsp. asymbiotica ATCC 43949]